MLKSALLLLAAVPAHSLQNDFNLASARAGSLPAAAAAIPQPQFQRLADDKASYIQISSAVKLKVDKKKGELTVTFPKVDFGDAAPGDKAHLFVKLLRESPAPVLSWATVVCSDGHYLGYKGSTVSIPEEGGSLSISETLALGSYPKLLVARTHPWLTGDEDPANICSPPFLQEMKDVRAETLPAKAGNYSFEYNPRKNTLKARW
jgi:hypothetical protein